MLKLGFLGTFEHSLDEKGRVSIPSKYKKNIEQTASDPEYRNVIVLVKSKEKCIEAIPAEEWARMMEEYSKNLKLDDSSEDLKYVNIKLSDASDQKIDKSGRILVPAKLREYAGISKKAVFVGGGNRFYIWDENEYEKYYKE
ncbi:MAG: division/cell wall cluster transcriptional repressor MraZ [Candidatus Goldiibacteriota bacterium]